MDQSKTAIALWQDEKELAEVKRQFAPTLNEQEFSLFCKMGMATGLNPFLREIYAVKYGNQCSIFIGRDGYRKGAQANKLYQGHTVDAVYADDIFEATPSTGEVTHKYGKDRTKLIGAYCIVHRAKCKPMYNYVEFDEYYAGHKLPDGSIKTTKYGPMKPTIWDTKPATMIKKVAEAQGLRGAFQELFAGTYEESEDWNAKSGSSAPKTATQTVKEPDISNTNKSDSVTDKNDSNTIENDNVIDAEVVEDAPPATAPVRNGPPVPRKPDEPPMTDHNRKKLFALWNQYHKLSGSKLDSAAHRIEKMQKFYGVGTTKDLGDYQAEHLIDRLETEIRKLGGDPTPPKVKEEPKPKVEHHHVTDCHNAKYEMKDGKAYCEECGAQCGIKTVDIPVDDGNVDLAEQAQAIF